MSINICNIYNYISTFKYNLMSSFNVCHMDLCLGLTTWD